MADQPPIDARADGQNDIQFSVPEWSGGVVNDCPLTDRVARLEDHVEQLLKAIQRIEGENH